MAIRKFDELSDNYRLRIFQTSLFLKVAEGKNGAEKEVETELRDTLKTPKEWRIFRKSLFRKVNAIRERIGLRRLGA